jgi:hypothetical protein
MHTTFWPGNLYLNLKKITCECGLDPSGLGPVADFCGKGNELSHTLKAGEFLEHFWLLKDCASYS